MPSNGFVAIPRVQAALPVRAVYLPERAATGGASPRFVETADPRRLIGSTYNNVVRDRARLIDMLDLYAAVSRSAGVYQAVSPPSVDAGRLARAIVEHERAHGRA